MRVFRNDALIKRRVKFTQRGSLIGMGLLLVSLILSTRQPLISWGFLLAGFVVAMASVRVGNRFVRPPRADSLLDKVLKGLDNRYVAYHYLLPADHVLLTPSGLIVLRMQEQHGRVSVHGERWRQHSFWQRMRVLFGEVGLGNPARKLQREIDAVRKALGEEDETPVDGLVVFYSGKVELEAQNPEFPTVLPDDLKATIRSMAEAHPALPSRRHKTLVAALSDEEAGTTSEVTDEAEEEPAEAPAPQEKRRSKRSRRKAKKRQ